MTSLAHALARAGGACLALAVLAVLAVLAAPAAEAKTYAIKPGPQAQAELAAALNAAGEDDTIRLEQGRFELSAGLALAKDGVTIRGRGADRTILSFTGQTSPGAGVSARGARLTLRDFAVENAQGPGVLVESGREITIRAVRAEWTKGLSSANGPAGFEIRGGKDVLLDGVRAKGAAGAGVLLSGSERVVVRVSRAEFNVAGFVVDNSAQVDLQGSIATRNAIGVALVSTPRAGALPTRAVRVFESQIWRNDTPDFAGPDHPLASLPQGSGVVIAPAQDVHLFNNDIGEHGGLNVAVLAYRAPIAEAGFDPLPRNLTIKANRFRRAGFAPQGQAGEILALAGGPAPDIVWDGATNYVAGGRPAAKPVWFAIADNVTFSGQPLEFVSLGLSAAGAPLAEGLPERGRPPLAAFPPPAPFKLPRGR